MTPPPERHAMRQHPTRRLVPIDGGSAAHYRSLTVPKYRRYWQRVLYLPDLPYAEISTTDTLIVPERLHRGMLDRAQPRLRQHLERGGEIVLLGDQAAIAAQPTGWLPGLRFEAQPTNFWWWLEPGAAPPVLAASPEHELFNYLTLADATWHHHGVLHPPEGVQVVLASPDGGAILTIDEVSTPGRLLATTLDPMWHFGTYFMPATERFLDGFLAWLARSTP